jgi:ABC-type multidrug transport system ATPase subunit
LFDKVLVLDKGHQVFYGPPKEARAYFEQLGYNSLPRQSTADYLTGCTDVNERQFAPGRSKDDVPSTPEALQSVFESSLTYQRNMEELEKFKALMEVEKIDQEALVVHVIFFTLSS